MRQQRCWHTSRRAPKIMEADFELAWVLRPFCFGIKHKALIKKMMVEGISAAAMRRAQPTAPNEAYLSAIASDTYAQLFGYIEGVSIATGDKAHAQ